MNRRDVHLSADRETATRVGARRGRPVVLTVDAGALHADGHVFRVSANGVWLTASVPSRYLPAVIVLSRPPASLKPIRVMPSSSTAQL